MVDAEPLNNGRRSTGVADGRVAQEAAGQGARSLRPGGPVHQHGLGIVLKVSQLGTLDEPAWKLSRQCRYRELLQPAQARADTTANLQDTSRRQTGYVRLNRDVLQSETQAREERNAVARRVRTATGYENRGRLENSGLFSLWDCSSLGFLLRT